MKKIFLTLLTPFILFGFEISFNKKFEEQIVPDKLSTHITINVLKETEAEVTPDLDSFNKFISKSNKVEKRAGEFSIRPKYNYHKGQSTLIGYNGVIRYRILSSSSKNMNKFLKKLLELKDDEDISVSISGLNWIISEKKSSEVIEELRLKSIIWAKKYASDISEEINNNCKIDKISISPTRISPIYQTARSQVMMKSASIQESNIPVPQASKNIISINPHYTMECK